MVSDSDSQVAAISPMIADSSPPTTTPISDPSQMGTSAAVTSQMAQNAPNIPVAAWAKFTTRTSRAISVRHTPSTA